MAIIRAKKIGDRLVGTLLTDRLIGSSGNDIIIAGGGDDVATGGRGKDSIRGGSGNDRLYGQKGDDKLFGDAGDDRLFGGDGNDVLFGSTGNDSLFGGNGNDRLYGDQGNDALFGGAGTDTAYFTGNFADHTFQVVAGKLVVTDIRPGTPDKVDTLAFDVENLHFSDQTVALSTLVANTPPTAVNDTGAVSEDAMLAVGPAGVLANDTDPQAAAMLQTLTVSKVNGLATNVGMTLALASGAHLTVNANGSYTYVADGTVNNALAQGAQRIETFTYEVSDGVGGTATANVSITVTGTNDSPIVSGPVIATRNEDSGTLSVNLLANASDPDTGAALSVVGIIGTLPPGSSLVGSILNINTGNAAYQSLDTGESSQFTLLYTVQDQFGGTASASTVITINGVNDAPVANTDTVSTNEDTSVTFSPLANDTDADIETLSITAASVFSGGGSVVVNGGNTITYTPAANASGPVVLKYTLFDGTTSSIGTVNVTVNAVNDAPVAGADQTVSTPENIADTVVVATATATDPADTGQTLTYAITGGNTGTKWEINPTTGAISLAAGQTLDRETDPASYALTITVTDNGVPPLSDTLEITINVNDLDDNATTAPVDSDAQANAVNENSPTGTYTGLTASSTDADATSGTITYAITGGTGLGLFSVDASGAVRVAGALDREAAASYTVEVTATPTIGAQSTASPFTITINDVDEFNVGAVTDTDGPTGGTAAEDAPMGTLVGITASAADLDATNNTITYSLSDDAGGRFAIDAMSGVVTTGATPLDYESATSHDIVVRATSSDGSISEQSFTIDVTDVNDVAPVLFFNSVDVDENTQVVATPLSAFDLDTTGEATIFTIGGVAGDDALFEIVLDGMGGFTLQFIAPAGVDYEFPIDGGNDNKYEVSITTSDGVNSSLNFVNVYAQNVNDNAPIAVDDTNAVTEDLENVVGGNVLFGPTGDTDADFDILAVIGGDVGIVIDPTDFVGVTFLDGTYGRLALFDNGLYLYAQGETAAQFDNLQTIADGVVVTDDFSYQVSDGTFSDVGKITINITGVNDAPVGVDDTNTATEDDTIATGNVLTNDTDPELDDRDVSALAGGMLSMGAFTKTGSFGAISIDAETGAYTYTLNAASTNALAAGQQVTDTFSYTVTDGSLTDTATLTITITGTNDTPTANAANASGNEDDLAVAITITGTDPDTLDAVDSFTIATLPANGTLHLTAADAMANVNAITASQVVTAPGNATTLYFRPNADFNGSNSFTYTAFDGVDTSAAATGVLAIAPVNDSPSLDLDTSLDAVANPNYVGGDDPGEAFQAAESNILAGVQIADMPAILDPDAGDTVSELTVSLAATATGTNGYFSLTATGLTVYQVITGVAWPGGTPDTFTVSGVGTQAQYLSLISNIRYVNDEATFDLDIADRAITVQIRDAVGALSNMALASVPVIANVTDGGGNGTFIGTRFDDTIDGAGGDDTITGAGGNDTIDGGTDTGPTGGDTAVYDDALSNYTINVNAPTGFVIAFTDVTENGPSFGTVNEGSDTLGGIEILSFNGGATVIDLTQAVQLFDDTGAIVGTFDLIQDAVTAAEGGAAPYYAVRINGTMGPGGPGVDVYSGNEDVVISEGIILLGLGTVTVNSISISGGGAGQTVAIDNIDVVAAAMTINAIQVNGEYASVDFTNGDVTGGDGYGLVVNGNDPILSVAVTDATFTNNGLLSNAAAINIFNYNDVLTLTNVTVTNTGPGAKTGISLSGDGFAPIGTVTLTGVVVTGQYDSNGVEISNYSDLTGLTAAGGNPAGSLSINVNAGGYGLQFFNIGADIELDDGSVTGLQVVNTNPAGIDADIGVFAGGGASHVVTGDSSNDTLFGDSDADTISGGAGNDILVGFLGDDTINGGDDDDAVFELAGPAGDGADTIDGGSNSMAGFDDLTIIDAFADDDDVVTVVYNGTLITSLDGGMVSNMERVTAAVDNGFFNPGLGLFGGGDAGSDTLSYAGSTASVSVDLGLGTASGFVANTILSALFGINFAIQGFENVTGGSGDDTLTGDGNANVLSGGDGFDTINGGAGADVLTGGQFGDTINTGAADDDLQDVVRYGATTEFGDAVSNFDDTGTTAQRDAVAFFGSLNTALDDIIPDDLFTFAVSDDVDNNDQDADLDITFEGLFLTGLNNEGVIDASLQIAADVAIEFNDEFAITSSVGQDALLVINSLDSNNFTVWYYVEAGTAEIQAAELTLIGAFTANGDSSFAQFIFA